MPTSPRSVEACLRLGIDPACLLHRPLDHFLRSERSPELAQVRRGGAAARGCMRLAVCMRGLVLL